MLTGFIGAVGLSIALLAAIWAFWPQPTTPTNIVNRPRPPQPTLQQAPPIDATTSAYLQFWLEDQAGAYAKQLETATGENKRALEALLHQTRAELVALKPGSGTPVAPPATGDGERFIRVHSKDD